MLVNENKIIVCCATAVTGGPELLHQLVDALRKIGRDASIAYYPFNQSFSCPEPYKKYDAPQVNLLDNNDVFIIVPESATWIIKNIKNARVGIWWLSVDNYFLAKHQSRLKDFCLRYTSLIKKRISMGRIRKYKNIIHFTQSEYAKNFLQNAGIFSIELTDYLGRDHLGNLNSGISHVKKNIVVYNPKKGQLQTKALMDYYPEICFVPILNMTPLEVNALLNEAKVYMDFGHHPGKDRPPREGAIAGCCVITGRKGSAGFYRDVPIPEKYKLDDLYGGYLNEFGPLVTDIFNNFEKNISEFKEYREIIIREPEVFMRQVRNIF